MNDEAMSVCERILKSMIQLQNSDCLPLKIIAAKRAGAELILVPIANFEEARPFETEKTAIVAVDSFDEALSVISQYSSR